MNHWHEWTEGRVLLVRPVDMWHETEKAWEMMNYSRSNTPRSEVVYKRCRRCGKVLF